MSSKDIHVHIGEVKTGKGDDKLQALLGSCVGIALLWPNKNIYGLAHCLLSESPKKSFVISGRYVDQAISSLLALMHIHKEDYSQIRAVVTGGGNMTMPEDTEPNKLVGATNVKVALKCLFELGIEIVHEETGGMEGRKITVHCSTGKYSIDKIPRTIAA